LNGFFDYYIIVADMTQTKVFLDIDGVLLGKKNGSVVLAKGADEFLRFVKSNFDCYWLTTHCQGDAKTAVNWLKPYVSKKLIKVIEQIKPTTFNVLKTDALPMDGNFFWVEDQPLASELIYLEKNSLLARLIRVDTYRNKEDLVECLSYLRETYSERLLENFRPM
jgi:hypothetical protein